MNAICINLPNPHITIHENIDQCGHHWNVNEERTRELRTPLNGIKLIRDIESKDLRFTAKASLNGLWGLCGRGCQGNCGGNPRVYEQDLQYDPSLSNKGMRLVAIQMPQVWPVESLG